MIVEDHAAVRKSLELLLRMHGYQIVGATHSPEHAITLVGIRRPDVVLLDIDLAGASGIALAQHLLIEHPELGILLYSGREEPDTLADGLACGVRGFALKAGSAEELWAAIDAVAEGETWLDPRLPRLLRHPKGEDPTERLSARELEVLYLISEGMTGQAVAEQLFLSPETIRTHVRNAMRKLGVRTRSHAIAMIVRASREPAQGEHPSRIRTSGGGAKNDRWGPAQDVV